MFPSSKVVHMESGTLDHKPIIIYLAGIPKRVNKPWRLEQMWMRDEGCRRVIEEAWSYDYLGSPMRRVEGKMDKCRRNLKWWSKVAFGNVTRGLREKKEQLRIAEEAAIKGGSFSHVQRLKREISKLLVCEEQMWKQWSCALWLQEGDNNTRYFHSRTSHRFRRNRIDALEDPDGVLCTDEDGISNILVNYYQCLFHSSNPSMMEEVVDGIPCSVSAEMNQMLIGEFTKEEVVTALKQMDPLKALGPDGLPPLFSQHYWLSIGDDVTDAVLSCLTSGVIPPSINRTYITLIPKVKSPSKVTNFHPISLCNIIYKLVSKVIANRLKGVLPLIILESQSAFQLDKAISNNILVAFETLHHMKNQKSKKASFMALKLDMSKAFDRVEWGFLEVTILKMGFNESLVALVMSCIHSASYSILVNGVPKGDIQPTRGIRQTPFPRTYF